MPDKEILNKEEPQITNSHHMTCDRCGKDCGERGDNEIILCGDCIKELHDAFVKWMNITAPFLKKVKKMNRKTKKLMERLNK